MTITITINGREIASALVGNISPAEQDNTNNTYEVLAKTQPNPYGQPHQTQAQRVLITGHDRGENPWLLVAKIANELNAGASDERAN